MHKPKNLSERERKYEPGSRIEYRFPPATGDELTPLFEVYTALTGRTVWPKMKGLFATAWRAHGPDTAAHLAALFASHGVIDLLSRLIKYEPAAPPTPIRQEVAAGLEHLPDLLEGFEQPDPVRRFDPTSRKRWDLVDCRRYPEHWSAHRWTEDRGWVCDACAAVP